MRMGQIFWMFNMIAIALAMAWTPMAWAQPAIDHSEYGSLLSAYVKEGYVDYGGLKKEEARLDRYLDILGKVNPRTLSRDVQMAFYINAYNAWTIKLILNHYPVVKSIKDLGTLFKSPWQKKFVKLAGKTVTLDHIEHDILRPVFKDPRVHFAVNCASKSCPPLLNEPYTGETLNRQLDRMTKNFINDPESNYVRDNVLYASRIFKWFGEDFGDDITSYVRSFADGKLARQMDGASKNLKIKYLDYDWSLNGS